MLGDTMVETTFLLQWLVIAFAVLLVLLIMINLLLRMMRRLARHHVSRTDLDLIGIRATVTHTIRPRKPGKIRCQIKDEDSMVVEAMSDSAIRSGRQVLITAISQGKFRVVPIEQTALAANSDQQDPKPPEQKRSDS